MGQSALESRSRRAPASRRRAPAGAAWLGVFAGTLTLALYLVGGNRSLDYDSGVTVGNFVATPSILDALTRQVVLNNHPALSLLDHLVYSAGGTSELALRVVPALSAAGTVGLLAAWCARRFTLLAGIAAGAIVATNPMFAELSREVRGYSIVTFCAVASTLLLVELLDARRGWRTYAYVAALAVGLGTHLYFGLVVVGHATLVLARRGLGWDWVRRWLVAGALGSLFYLGTLHTTAVYARGGGGRHFQPSFPIDLASAALGGHALTIIPLAILVLAGIRLVGRQWLPVAAVVAALLGSYWVVRAPAFLLPRYLVWLVPAVAVVAALAVARWRMAFALAAVASIAAVAYQAPRWGDSPYPARTAAGYVTRVELQGGRACGSYLESIAAYTRPRQGTDDPRGCDLLLENPSAPARHAFHYRWALPGDPPLTLRSNRPRASFLPLPPVAIRRTP